MSDLHTMPLTGHDIEFRPWVRAKVYCVKQSTGCRDWFWHYTGPRLSAVTAHGPFTTWAEAYASARRMLEEC